MLFSLTESFLMAILSSIHNNMNNNNMSAVLVHWFSLISTSIQVLLEFTILLRWDTATEHLKKAQYLATHSCTGNLACWKKRSRRIVLTLHKFQNKTILVILTMEKRKSMRPKSHTKYDVGFYQGIVMKHSIKRNGAKVTTSNECFKD